MAECRRIFTRGRLLLALGFILVLNIALYINEQVESDYGFARYTTDFYIMLYGETNAEEYKEAYQATVERYRGYELSDVKALLLNEKEMLDMYSELKSILRVKDSTVVVEEHHSRIYDYYIDNYPHLVKALEKGEEPNASEIRVNSVVTTELLNHINKLIEYPEYLSTVQKNAQKTQDYAFLGGADSFNGRNTLKTAAEFRKLGGVTLELGINKSVESFVQYKVADFLLLVAVILVCLAFMEERKKGLWSVVHSTCGGRMVLALRRVGILSCFSVVYVVLLFGSVLFASLQLYGGFEDLGRAVQSVEIFQKLPVTLTLSEFLIQYFVVRAMSTFLLALLLWFLLSAVNNAKYTLVVLAIFLVTEYAMFTWLPVQSAFNLLKYFNVFAYINLSSLYINYLNIDLFGYPFGIRAIAFYAMAPLSLVFGGGCIWVQCRRKPFGAKDVLGSIAIRLNSVVDRILHHLGMLGMELYKALILQRGVLVLILVIYVASCCLCLPDSKRWMWLILQ